MEEHETIKPKILQLEVTNKCNFNCLFCIRRAWQTEFCDINFDLFKRISKDFQDLERLDLYGLGEPLTHPKFLDMVKMAKDGMKDGQLFFSTNGSLLSPNIADRLISQIGVDSVSFSIDTFDLSKLEDIRIGSEASIIIKNLKYVARIRKVVKKDFKLGLETVVMRSNYMDLPEIVRIAAENDIDYITISNVVPYTKNVFELAIYMTVSKPVFEVSKPMLTYGWRLVHDFVVETIGGAYLGSSSLDIMNNYKRLWEFAGNAGYTINIPLMLKDHDKIELIDDVKENFDKASLMAKDYGIQLSLPNLYADAKERSCPYINKDAMFVRADGSIVPCLNFAYTHLMYVNCHIKQVKEVVFGNLLSSSIKDVWNDQKYKEFRRLRRNMFTNIPWCGDCVYSTTGCWFNRTNDMDCFLNVPSCNECLYSVGIAKCVI